MTGASGASAPDPTYGGILTLCPACGGNGTWCVGVHDNGQHDRYCDDCKHQWATLHASPDSPAPRP